jgi:ATP-dependent RNA helicase DeaD
MVVIGMWAARAPGATVGPQPAALRYIIGMDDLQTTPSAAGSLAFSAIGLEPTLIQALVGLGYEEPTPIQTEAIPPILEGRDLLGQAATGTGKSAAFTLPLIQRLSSRGRARAQPGILMLVPTRELAMQLSEAVYRYGRGLGISVLPIYGGQSFSQQLKVLRRGVDVVVATPGRALDHIRRNTLQLGGLMAVVLDEADEMLDMGFAEDLEAILAATPETRQTVLFSATMPPRIGDIGRQHLRNPVQIQIARAVPREGEAPRVREVVYFVPRSHKVAALGRVLDMEDPEAAIVFCRTRTEVDELTEMLNAHGHRADALHGGMSQEQRDRVMKRIRSGAIELVAATDVAARGLDIPHLTHVINFDVPNAPESYVHRIGRVGRAGREGVAVTLAEPREQRFIQNVERLTRRSLQVARLPTVADLRDRRLAQMREQLIEALADPDLDRFQSLVDSLSDLFEPNEIAAAAIKLAQMAMGQGVSEGDEIPDPTPSRSAAPQVRRAPGRKPSEGPPRPGAGGGGRPGGSSGPMERIYVGVGREAGVRPQDLVGAITGECGISGQQIGKIETFGGFSIVEVSAGVAPEVIRTLHGRAIKGRRVTVRKDRPARR